MNCENRRSCPFVKEWEKNLDQFTWRDQITSRIVPVGLGALIGWSLSGQPLVGAAFTLLQVELQKPLKALAFRISKVPERANQIIGSELGIINRGLSLIVAMAVTNIGLSFFGSPPINNDLVVANFFIVPALSILMTIGTVAGHEIKHSQYHQQQLKKTS